MEWSNDSNLNQNREERSFQTNQIVWTEFLFPPPKQDNKNWFQIALGTLNLTCFMVLAGSLNYETQGVNEG